jgi:hypothetical protein
MTTHAVTGFMRSSIEQQNLIFMFRLSAQGLINGRTFEAKSPTPPTLKKKEEKKREFKKGRKNSKSQNIFATTW